MFFNKEKKKSGYVKAKSPETRKRQKAAIAAYYAKSKTTIKKIKQSVVFLHYGLFFSRIST